MISVIIVSWNAKAHLIKCLDSLGEFRGEIIVVDNASTDGTQDAIKAHYPWVKLIENSENVGFAKANNQGIEIAQGEYLALINSDIEVLGDCFLHLRNALESNPQVGLCGPEIIGQNGKRQATVRGFPSLKNALLRALALDRIFPEHPKRTEVLTGCFWFIRRAALLDVGLLDERFFIYGEDIDFSRRFWQSGWQLMYVPWARAIHYGGASSANAPVRFYVEQKKADLQYWHKHGNVTAYFFISILHELIRLMTFRKHKTTRSFKTLQFLCSQTATSLLLPRKMKPITLRKSFGT